MTTIDERFTSYHNWCRTQSSMLICLQKWHFEFTQNAAHHRKNAEGAVLPAQPPISVLLTEFSGLLTKFSGLLTEFSVLQTEFPGLLTEFSVLLTEFSVLLTEFSGLLTEFSEDLNGFAWGLSVDLGGRSIITEKITEFSGRLT